MALSGVHFRFIVVALVAFSFVRIPAFAAGEDDTTLPPPSPTATCPKGQINNPKTGKCTLVKSNSLSDLDRYQAVRELAYLERYDAATIVLEAISDQSSDRVFTYRGFLERKQGQIDQANRYYQLAIQTNPNNLLARSYMAQGFVELGDLSAARRQHDEILARGGQGTWAEVSLRDALATGRTYRY